MIIILANLCWTMIFKVIDIMEIILKIVLGIQNKPTHLNIIILHRWLASKKNSLSIKIIQKATFST
jgi:hypothetical protein